jgi:hypothetical protein
MRSFSFTRKYLGRTLNLNYELQEKETSEDLFETSRENLNKQNDRRKFLINLIFHLTIVLAEIKNEAESGNNI